MASFTAESNRADFPTTVQVAPCGDLQTTDGLGVVEGVGRGSGGNVVVVVVVVTGGVGVGLGFGGGTGQEALPRMARKDQGIHKPTIKNRRTQPPI